MADIPQTDSVGTINQSQQGDPKAHDVAQDALRINEDPSEDSEKGGSDGVSVVPQDGPDLVDRMNQMVQSGNIDRGAFAGERNDDDEESELGKLDAAENDGPGQDGITSVGNHG